MFAYPDVLDGLIDVLRLDERFTEQRTTDQHALVSPGLTESFDLQLITRPNGEGALLLTTQTSDELSGCHFHAIDLLDAEQIAEALRGRAGQAGSVFATPTADTLVLEVDDRVAISMPRAIAGAFADTLEEFATRPAAALPACDVLGIAFA